MQAFVEQSVMGKNPGVLPRGQRAGDCCAAGRREQERPECDARRVAAGSCLCLRTLSALAQATPSSARSFVFHTRGRRYGPRRSE